MQLRRVGQRIAPTVGAIVVGVNVDVHQDIIGAVPNDFPIEGRIESGDPDGTWSDPPDERPAVTPLRRLPAGRSPYQTFKSTVKSMPRGRVPTAEIHLTKCIVGKTFQGENHV